MNGWERRGGRWFLYDARRENGRVVKVYVAAGRDEGFGRVMALQLADLRDQRAEARALVVRSWEAWQERLEAVVRPAAEADSAIRAGVEVILIAVGLHRPSRKPWRKMRGPDVNLRQNRMLLDRIDKALGQVKAAGPLINYSAPPDDPEAVAVYEAARKGDATAVAKLPDLIRRRGWVEWIGNLGWQATHQIVARIAADDPVLKAGLTAKASALWTELAGLDPTPLDKVLVQRIVNNWLTVHALEVEQAIRPPVDPKSAVYLDRRLSQAQRRLCEAARSLASVRRLNVTVLLAMAGQQQVNVGK